MLFSQSTKFYNDLYEQNLIAQELSSGCEHTKYCSFNTISSESSDPEKVYSLFVDYIENTKKQGLNKEDFELAKRTVYASHIKSFDSVENIGDNFIYNLFDGCDIFDTSEIINSISFEYVSELLNNLFKEEYYAMSIVYPTEKEN
jgi:predicted Zn-dependent peptidase